ncbi:low molecular weight phosphotyrosine protein phosphatase [Halobacillus shinanisalinarum]|uniref:protein-tyrosine-phosphatase n=1 Tax=Halobacillus shinanisalinarum TaxID=2932258 RepID=A0ABY4GWK1_9BACI|nr:low molecular weight protein-tyrosine-phosphatase [Halobacillus shinanisalinarum]UOQ92518.1 low molecular weight phosphotyrosine protein phosphatase [Halobacillus shinanisalinarum]
MIHVLFVCLGNICRSPMAEAIFRDLIKEENLGNHISVDSAGIGHWHVGAAPHEGTRAILDKNRISFEGMLARQVDSSDWDRFDYIIAMDQKNMNDLQAIREKNGVTVKKFMDYALDADETDVPDPYFTGNFDQVYQLVTEGCLGLLNEIKRNHKFKEEI